MRFTYRAAGPIAAAAALTLLPGGCSRTQQDWRAAQQAATAQAYEIFAERHPDSELAGVARQRVAQLTEEAAWQQATRANTVAAYRDYLAKYPDGSWSQDARIRMESRSLAVQPPQAAQGPQLSAQAPGPSRATGSAMPASSRPLSAAGKPASTDVGSAEGFAVQLGAFSSVANARSAWNQLSSRFGPELRGLSPLTVPVRSSGRQLYRLETRVSDRDAARRLCRQLQQQAQGCLPLP